MEDVQHILELLQSGAMGFNLSGDGGNPPASQLSISELPDVVIEDKHVHRGLDCTVCGNAFKHKEDAKQMPCKHIFHDMCLLPWLSRRNTCPTCRYELPTLDEDYEARKRIQRKAQERGQQSPTVEDYEEEHYHDRRNEQDSNSTYVSSMYL
ncbi:RING-type E3 ubiquitin transferase [Balamuthia mandrillaris]